MLGAVTARAEAQTMRLACLYALLDSSPVIKLAHLDAALALWDFCERSAAHIFGSSLGHRMADTLLAELRQVPNVGLTRTEMIHEVFGSNKSAAKIAEALQLLHDNGLAHRKDDLDPETGHATAERWFPTLAT